MIITGLFFAEYARSCDDMLDVLAASGIPAQSLATPELWNAG